MFEIKKGAPVHVGSKRNSYPVSELNVGEYFEFPADQRNAVNSACYYERMVRDKTKRFTVRKVSEKMAACWRIA